MKDKLFDNANWSDWMKFPDPRKGEYLLAPFGFGVYQLRKGKKFILFGLGKNLAYRMSSLLPKPYGVGTRNNEIKRQYVLDNIRAIEYRTIPFDTEQEMKGFESKLKSLNIHLYNT